MENPFRYRVIAPTFSPLLGAAFFLIICMFGLYVALLSPLRMALGFAMWMAAEKFGFSLTAFLPTAIWVAFFTLTGFGMFMISLWAAIRWGRFSGLQLQFVRENLASKTGK